METPKPLRTSYGLLGGALTLFLALLILPTSHWIASLQTRMLVAPPGEFTVVLKDMGVKELPYNADPAAVERTRKEIVERFANDYNVQLAAAVSYYPPMNSLTGDAQSTARLAPLRALKLKFPEHRVTLSAHILRYASSYLGIHRDQEVETYNSGKPFPASTSKVTPPSAEYLAAYDKDAKDGEEADPENAYFPLMRSVGYFAANRDSEGIAALLRAGQKPHMNDYTDDDANASWKAYEIAYGPQSAVTRACVSSALLFPHYARMRSVARLAVYEAAKAEEAGRKEEGFAIRHAMLHISSLLRTDSHSAIGTLVGIACAAIMTTRPGGELTDYEHVPTEQRQGMRRDLYLSYLRKIDKPSEADWTLKELEAGAKTRELINTGFAKADLFKGQVDGLLDQWTLDMVLLTNALELLALGGAMLLLIKLRKDTGNTPITVAIGLCTAFFALALLAHWSEVFVAFRMIFHNLTDTTQNLTNEGASPFSAFRTSVPVFKGCIVGLSMLGPILMLALLGLVRLLNPKETGSVVASGLRTGGLGIALALLVAYGAALGVTLQKEQTANAQLDRFSRDQPRYLAEIQGKPWPL